jgi:hypothetical protein
MLAKAKLTLGNVSPNNKQPTTLSLLSESVERKVARHDLVACLAGTPGFIVANDLFVADARRRGRWRGLRVKDTVALTLICTQSAICAIAK